MYSEEVQALITLSRQLIYNVYADLLECPLPVQKIIGYGIGPKKMTEHLSWLKPNKKHVTFGFNYGMLLPDPEKLLEGTGKTFRHVKIRQAKDFNNPAFMQLLKSAIEQIKRPD